MSLIRVRIQFSRKEVRGRNGKPRDPTQDS